MTVVVRLFAGARELAGVGAVSVKLPDGATVAELRGVLKRDLTPQTPFRSAEGEPLSRLISRSRIAVNQEFADDGAIIPDGAEVALIPPVSGG